MIRGLGAAPSVLSSPEQALAEAIAFLQGIADEDPGKAASYIMEQLALRGFSIQPIASDVLRDLRPETLHGVRRALGLTIRRVAVESGLNPVTVSSAERGDTRSHEPTLRAISDALIRLGAKRP